MFTTCINCLAKEKGVYLRLKHCTLCNVALFPEDVLNNKASLCKIHKWLIKRKIAIDEEARKPIELLENIKHFGIEIDSEYLLGCCLCKCKNKHSSLCLKCERELRRRM